jgi:hypothetical protein
MSNKAKGVDNVLLKQWGEKSKIMFFDRPKKSMSMDIDGVIGLTPPPPGSDLIHYPKDL